MFTFHLKCSGIVNTKWHTKKKVSPQARLLISKSNEERDYFKREAIFASHREELCVEFRYFWQNLNLLVNFTFIRASSGKKNVDQICRGFFEDSRHLGAHFQYMTDSPPLDQNIEENLKTFIGTVRYYFESDNSFHFPPGHLDLFLKDVDRSVEAKKKLREIELVCETDLQGATTLRDLHILVCLPGLALSSNYEYFRGGVASTLTRAEVLSSSGSPHQAGLSRTPPVRTPVLTCWQSGKLGVEGKHVLLKCVALEQPILH